MALVPAYFMADRERMRKSRLESALRKIVFGKLSDSKELRLFEKQIRERRINQKIVNDDDKAILSSIIKNTPELQHLLGAGEVVPGETQVPGGVEKYIGKMFPTFLNPPKFEDGVKTVPRKQLWANRL